MRAAATSSGNAGNSSHAERRPSGAHTTISSPPLSSEKLRWAAWAQESGGPYAADYEMNPEITADPAWPGASAVLTALPILSLVATPDDLFSPEYGIHENPIEEGPAWERRTFVELIGAGDPEPDFSVAAGLRMQGGSVRQASRSPKKSFRLLFKDEYGPKSLDHAIFPDSPTASFETLVLRTGYNRSWAHWAPVGRARADYASGWRRTPTGRWGMRRRRCGTSTCS